MHARSLVELCGIMLKFARRIPMPKPMGCEPLPTGLIRHYTCCGLRYGRLMHNQPYQDWATHANNMDFRTDACARSMHINWPISLFLQSLRTWMSPFRTVPMMQMTVCSLFNGRDEFKKSCYRTNLEHA